MKKERIIFCIIGCILLVIFIAIPLFIKVPVHILHIRGITVKIVGEYNDNVKKYIDDLNYIDDSLIPTVSKIIITENPIKYESGITNIKGIENANGLALPEQKIIYLSSNSYDSFTLKHEFYHMFDFKYGGISNTEEFITLINKHESELNLNNYFYTNPAELFVGIMLEYEYFEDRLQANSPEIHRYIQELIKEIQNE